MSTGKKTVKVTMNMREDNIEDVQKISEMTGVTNKTSIVLSALRTYKRLLELQIKENEKLYTEKDGQKRSIEFIFS